MKRLFILATILISISLSCSDESDPAPDNKLVFELEVPAELYNGRDAYIIATGPDGGFLGFEKIVNGQTLVIDTAIASLPDKINITYLVYSPPNSESPRENYRFVTHTDVPTGSKWYDPSLGEGFSFNKFATVSIDNVPGGSTCSVSSMKGGVYGSTSVPGSSVTLSASLDETPADVFVSTIGAGQNPRYHYAPSVTDGATLDLDYTNDFLEFDDVISVPADGDAWIVIARGYNTPVSQITYNEKNTHDFGFWYETNNNGLRIGVNEGYDSYWTFWTRQSGMVGTTYEKWGAPPSATSFEAVDGDFTITNDDLNDFEYTTTGTFNYFLSEFFKFTPGRFVSWTAVRPMGSTHVIMTELPAQVLGRFPDLADIPASLEYAASTFFRTTTAKASDLYIDRKHDGVRIFLEGETWSIRK